MTDTKPPLRVLFCGAVLQNFFDLPAAEIGKVWQATGEMLKGIRDLPGVTVLGTIDDDQTMVGTSPNGWPWDVLHPRRSARSRYGRCRLQPVSHDRGR